MYMKRILLGFCMAACALFASAKDYTDQLTVSINGMSTPPKETTISVEELDNGQISIVLKNFILEMPGEDPIYVGHIYVENVDLTPADGYNSFSLSQRQVRATAGDLEGVLPDQWIGQDLSDAGLFIDMDGKITDSKFYCTLGLMFGPLDIDVVFGTDEFPSGIRSAQTANPNKLVDVYSILGVRVKNSVKQAEALDGLQRGIYIVDGKKVIKK